MNFTNIKIIFTNMNLNIILVKIYFTIIKFNFTLYRWNIWNWKSILHFRISIVHNGIWILFTFKWFSKNSKFFSKNKNNEGVQNKFKPILKISSPYDALRCTLLHFMFSSCANSSQPHGFILLVTRSTPPEIYPQENYSQKIKFRNANKYITRTTGPWVKNPNASEANYKPKQLI